MNLGEKIFELRKELNITQEQLAEKMNVTRQTISKWELNETTPDIKQAKELSKIFKVSLDELTNNNVKNILNEKVSNTEKLAWLILKILKFLGIIFIVILIIDVISLILFSTIKTTTLIEETTKVTLDCIKDKETYIIEVDTNKNYSCKNCSKEMNKELKNIIDYNNLEKTVRNIENYFENSNGTCE